jgi:hypothetical protein
MCRKVLCNPHKTKQPRALIGRVSLLLFVPRVKVSWGNLET